MIQPYIDDFFFQTRIASTTAQEIARIPIAPNGDGMGRVEMMIGAVGAGGRAILDEVRIRFFKAGTTLVVKTPTRPEAPDMRGPLATTTLEIVAVGTDLVARATLPTTNQVDVFVLCNIRGFYGS